MIIPPKIKKSHPLYSNPVKKKFTAYGHGKNLKMLKPAKKYRRQFKIKKPLSSHHKRMHINLSS